MRGRDSNETGVVCAYQPRPAIASLEGGSCPLITKDYGVSAELQLLAQLERSGSHVVRATRKVYSDSRYVVEFQVVSRCGPPSGALAFDLADPSL